MERLKEFIAGVCMVIVIGVCIFFVVCIMENIDTEEETAEEPEKLIIVEPEPCEYGRVRIYRENEIVFEYSGNIDIENDGTDGKEIVITGRVEE